MSQENVEIVRRMFEASKRASEAYWRNPYSYADALHSGTLRPEIQDQMRLVHPEVRWTPAFSTNTYEGYLGVAQAWDEFLEAAGSYTLTLRELIDSEGDQVVAVMDGTIKGRGSGVEASALLCTVFTIRDGLIVAMRDYLELADALEAVGLSEQDAHADS